MITKSKFLSNKISEEELNQELSTDELKDVAGGPSIIDNTRAAGWKKRNIVVDDDLKKEESFSKRDNTTTKYNRQDF